MNTEINDKRDNFRFEIVSKQKQEMFRKRRMDHLQLNHSTPQQNEKLHLKCFQELQQNQNIQQNFAILQQELTGPMIYQVVMELLDSNFHLYLLENLQNQYFVEETLQTLTVILETTKVTVGRYFVKLGLLQYLLQYMENLEYTHSCTNIYGNLAIQSSDYGQILLYQSIHKQLFNILQNKVLNFEQITEYQQKIARSIIRVFAVLAEVGEKSNLDFQPQLLELLDICSVLYERKFEIDGILEIIYFVAKKDPEKTHHKVKWILDDLLANTTEKSPYSRNLMIVCSNLVLLGLNIKEIERIGVQIPQLLPYVIRILRKMVSVTEYHHYMSTDLVWWEKLTQLVQRTEDKNSILNIIITLEYPISEDWMFRFVYEFLEKNEHKTRHVQGLNFIKLLLRSEDQKIIYLIRAHQIHLLIEQLCESKNYQISELAESVLIQINAKNK